MQNCHTQTQFDSREQRKIVFFFGGKWACCIRRSRPSLSTCTRSSDSFLITLTREKHKQWQPDNFICSWRSRDVTTPNEVPNLTFEPQCFPRLTQQSVSVNERWKRSCRTFHRFSGKHTEPDFFLTYRAEKLVFEMQRQSAHQHRSAFGSSPNHF